MAEFKAHKVVSALPSTIEADTVYFVRTGAGFDLFVSDTTGNVAYAVNGPDADWSKLSSEWDTPPTLNATIASGDVYNYTLSRVTRYRLVPAPYFAANDAFYTGFDGTTLSGLVAARGDREYLMVTRAQLDAAISNGTYAIEDGGKTYTFGDSQYNVDTSGVGNMAGLFSSFFYVTNFNEDIGYWDVSNVTNMSSMFNFVAEFNQPLDRWNVGNVTNMFSMFQYAVSFNQPLDTWDVSNVTSMSNMLSFCDMSAENYSRTLIGWANRAYNGGANNGVKSNVGLGAVNRNYNNTTYADAWPNQAGQQFTDAVAARAYLVNTLGWTITDGGQV